MFGELESGRLSRDQDVWFIKPARLAGAIQAD